MRALTLHLVASSAFGLLTLASPALANPLDASIAAGSASISGEGTANLTVNQATDKAIINWNTFNIDFGETTTFVQPGVGSVILNRVTGGLGASTIDGALKANGNVFLINPDGILFGAGSTIDANGFVATTAAILDDDFLAGRYFFGLPGNPSASIVNRGLISVEDAGFAALVAPGVRNDGVITARLGDIGLASANGFTLDFYGDRLITLAVDDEIAGEVRDVATGMPLEVLVENAGTLKADGGTVQLTAAAARKVVDSVINNKGVIEANSVGMKNGKIVLGAATASTKKPGLPKQTVKVSGTLSASGKKKGETGGFIQVTAEELAFAYATLDASGWAGGGTVLIGGDVGGGNGNAAVADVAKAALEDKPVVTATITTVDQATNIDASATQSGDGGKVVIWADRDTDFAGTVAAKGAGEQGGGGFAEVSGLATLSFEGAVELGGAGSGENGTLLLDPLNVIIGGSGPSGLSVSALLTALTTSDVVVTTGTSGAEAGDIMVAQSVTWANGNDLTLSAYRNVIVNNAVTIANTAGGNLTLRADESGTGTGTVSFLGTGHVDYSASTGQVSILYNPLTDYTAPTDYVSFVVTNGSVANQSIAYMLVNDVFDLQNINQNRVGNYALGNDIDANATAGWNGGAGFLPIGNFRGVLDGQGFTIDGLTIHSSETFVGLFGDTVGATIRDLALADVDIVSTDIDEFGDIVGGIVGYNYGSIVNSQVEGALHGNGQNDTVGGIAGANLGSILQSTSVVAISGAHTAGGLVGHNFGTISESSADVALSASVWGGGLVGFNQIYNTSIPHWIETSYAIGSVSAENVYPTGQIGGLVGFNFDGIIRQSYSLASVGPIGAGSAGGLVALNGGIIDQTFSTASVVALDNNSSFITSVGTLIASGINNGGAVTNSYATGSITIGVGSIQVGSAGIQTTPDELRAALPVGFDPFVWGLDSLINGGYPHLLWQMETAPQPTVTVFSPPFGIEPPPPPPPPPPPVDTSGIPADVTGSRQASENFGQPNNPGSPDSTSTMVNPSGDQLASLAEAKDVSGAMIKNMQLGMQPSDQQWLQTGSDPSCVKIVRAEMFFNTGGEILLPTVGTANDLVDLVKQGSVEGTAYYDLLSIPGGIQPGDILVWSSGTAKGAGHLAYVTSVTASSVQVQQRNMSTPDTRSAYAKDDPRRWIDSDAFPITSVSTQPEGLSVTLGTTGQGVNGGNVVGVIRAQPLA